MTKTVTITVTEPNWTQPETITISFDGDVMPEVLDQFIVDHVGTRPDRKG